MRGLSVRFRLGAPSFRIGTATHILLWNASKQSDVQPPTLLDRGVSISLLDKNKK